MDLGTDFTIPEDARRAMQALTNEESSKALAETGRKLIAREGLFQKHFDEGQSKWPEGSPEYRAQKERKYGSTEKFVKTGRARDNLKREGGEMMMRVQGTARKLQIWLKRMVDGRNVLSTAQRGHFSGLKTSSGRFISKDRVHAGDAKGVKGASRVSGNAREITVVLPGDEPIAEAVVREEVGITLEKRQRG